MLTYCRCSTVRTLHTVPLADSGHTRTRGRTSATIKGELAAAEDLGDVEALSGVRKYPVRIKCALLAWTTLEEGLEMYGKATNAPIN